MVDSLFALDVLCEPRPNLTSVSLGKHFEHEFPALETVLDTYSNTPPSLLNPEAILMRTWWMRRKEEVTSMLRSGASPLRIFLDLLETYEHSKVCIIQLFFHLICSCQEKTSELVMATKLTGPVAPPAFAPKLEQVSRVTGASGRAPPSRKVCFE